MPAQVLGRDVADFSYESITNQVALRSVGLKSIISKTTGQYYRFLLTLVPENSERPEKSLASWIDMAAQEFDPFDFEVPQCEIDPINMTISGAVGATTVTVSASRRDEVLDGRFITLAGDPKLYAIRKFGSGGSIQIYPGLRKVASGARVNLTPTMRAIYEGPARGSHISGRESTIVRISEFI